MPHPDRARPRRLAAALLLVPALLAGAGCGGAVSSRRPDAAKRADAAPHDRGGAGGETYRAVVENRFQAAAREPLSTFAADVDTAPYSNVRRFLLRERRLPPTDAVLLAGMVNYFPYDYPAPPEGDPVAFSLALAECPWNDRHLLARVAIRAADIPPYRMPPRNLVFLVDTSGSMDEPNRLPLLKRSLLLLAERLTARDRVAVVAYAGSAGLVLPPTAGNDKEAIRRAVAGLDAGGSTNGGEGIQLAYRVARQAFIPGGLNRVILGTDGDFNVGVTGEPLVRLVEEQRRSGVFLTVLGFGMGNLKNAELEELAYRGAGHYAYIDSDDEARKVFVEQGAALVTVAKDVKLQVEFNPGRVAAYRLLGYESRLLRAEEFDDDTRLGGAIGSGHTVTALYEIVPAGQRINLDLGDADPLRGVQAAPGEPSGPWLTAKMRFKDPVEEKSELASRELHGAPLKLAEAPADFRFAAAVAELALTLRGSPYRGSASYAHARALAAGALGADRDGRRRELLTLIDAAAELSDK
jgi:Ca-activated chloride channel family protein